MRGFKYSISLFLFVLSSLFTVLNAQEQNQTLEKIYTQTDKPLYFPGESVWFKSYIVSADHTISIKNDIYSKRVQ